MYNVCERVHEEFFQEHLGGGDEWDVVKPPWQLGGGAVDGTFTDFQNMHNWAYYSADLSVPANYTIMGQWLDITNFVDYLILNSYAGMGDWPSNNWRAGRDQRADGIWRFAVWDAEWGMGIYGRAPSGGSAINSFDALDPNAHWTEIGLLYAALHDSPEFRLLWADRVQEHFRNGGALTPAHILSRIDELAQELISLIPSMDTSIANWALSREPTYFSQMSAEGLVSTVEAPTFSQHGGRIPAGFTLSMTAPAGTIYYTTDGTDPRVKYAGNVAGAASAYASPVPLNTGTRVLARARQGSTWSALTDATFTSPRWAFPCASPRSCTTR